MEHETGSGASDHRLELGAMTTQNIIVWNAKPLPAHLIFVWS